MDPEVFLTLLGLPAIAGIVLGVIFTGKVETSSKKHDDPQSRAVFHQATLPDDPAIVRIATLAGRTTEAKAKVRDLVAAGASDEEIAEWLSLVLFSDPGWLDNFILTVPEDRRIALSRLTIFKVGKLQSDAAWQLIRSSPYARQAARSDVEIERRKGLDILGYCMDSPLAAETLLNPSFEFTGDEINKSLRWSYGDENIECIIDAWKQGRWKENPPGFLRGKWENFRNLHKDDLAEIKKSLPAEVLESVEQFDSFFENQKKIDSIPVGQLPTIEDLSKLSEDGLHEAFSNQWLSGSHIPLKTLVQLPGNLRKRAIENYFEQNDDFHPEMFQTSIEEADGLDLTDSERQMLLGEAARLIWETQGDYHTALGWAARITDAKGRADSEEKILTKLAQEDPQSALDYLNGFPTGELRDKIERIATEAQP